MSSPSPPNNPLSTRPLDAEPSEGEGIFARVCAHCRAWLAHARASSLIIAAALLLTSGALTLGLTADDYFHLAAVRGGAKSEGLTRAPWDLFAFVRGDANSAQRLMDDGTLPWWADKATVLAFFRPLSSLTHWLDYRFWPSHHALIHLHSLLWFGLLLFVVSRLFRRLTAALWVANLALFLYALDDARASLVGWIATRNLLVAMTFGFLALLLHHRARVEGDRNSRWLAPPLFAVALLAGESAVQVCGYLFAHALFLDRGSLRARLGALAPYVGILLLWRIPYSLLGYGARGSGLYFDPGHEPLQFLAALSVRMPTLLLAQFGLVFSDLYDAVTTLAPALVPYYLLLAALVIATMVWLIRPLWQRVPEVRFWTVGALLATIPVCAGPIDDRLLAGPGVGFCAVLAYLFAALLDRTYLLKTSRLVRLAGLSLALLHGLVAPLLLPFRTLSVDAFEALLVRASATIPSEPEVVAETVVVLNPPVDLFAVYFPLYRAAHEIPQPAHFRWLTTGVSAILLERIDLRTLRIRPEKGFLSNSIQWMFRSPKQPFSAGDTVTLSEVTFEITQLTEDGRPAEVLARFREPLESPSLKFMRWGTSDYLPFTPPAVGKALSVPAVDMLAAMFGG